MYEKPVMTATSLLASIRVSQHESSSQALLIDYTLNAKTEETVPSGEQATCLVKTISQVAQFIRELSRMFPEAGLPLSLGSDEGDDGNDGNDGHGARNSEQSKWHSLLTSMHSFNSSRNSATASALLDNIILFPILNAMCSTWLLPTVRPSTTTTVPSTTNNNNNNLNTLMGVESIVLHSWVGDVSNGELVSLAVGDHILVIHEQGDWAYCRKSPDSTEAGYVPLQYLRKLGNLNNGISATPPALPPLISQSSKEGRDGRGADGADKSGKSGSRLTSKSTVTEELSGGGSNKKDNGDIQPFTLKTMEGFDELIVDGITVELDATGMDATGTKAVDGDVVSINITASKWEPSSSIIRKFSSTDDDPNASTLRFVVGKGNVTEAIDHAVKSIPVDRSGVVVCNSSYGYGDIGLPGLVNSKSFLVYKIRVLNVAKYNGIIGQEEDVAEGPEALIFRSKPKSCTDYFNKGNSGINGTREQMPAPIIKKTVQFGSTDDEATINNTVEGRDSMSTAELLAHATEHNIILGLGGEDDNQEHDDEGRSSIIVVTTNDGLSAPEGTRSRGNSRTTRPVSGGGPPPMPVTPPPPPPPNFRDKQAFQASPEPSGKRPGLVDITPPPLGASDGLPTSPSDQLMSPVSQAMYSKNGGGGGGGLLRNMMIKKSSGALDGPMSTAMPPPLPTRGPPVLAKAVSAPPKPPPKPGLKAPPPPIPIKKAQSENVGGGSSRDIGMPSL
jgi:hypothetical protein